MEVARVWIFVMAVQKTEFRDAHLADYFDSDARISEAGLGSDPPIHSTDADDDLSNIKQSCQNFGISRASTKAFDVSHY